MSVDYFMGYLSFLVAVMNGIGTIYLYIRHIRSIRDVFCYLRTDEAGEVEVIDPLVRR
ncbi:MAG: hypothetical protein GXY48_03125 [Methanomicrobiales archaeon]|nr:hypothetical protein [Methanomicrobiales archaeon]